MPRGNSGTAAAARYHSTSVSLKCVCRISFDSLSLLYHYLDDCKYYSDGTWKTTASFSKYLARGSVLEINGEVYFASSGGNFGETTDLPTR